MCGSAVMPNDSFSALCLMILMSRCVILLPSSPPSSPLFPPEPGKQVKTQQQPGSKPGLGRLGWQQGCVFSTLGKMWSRGGIQVSHSLAHACGSRGFPTSSKRENSPLWTRLRDCKGRMQCPAVIKNAFPFSPCSWSQRIPALMLREAGAVIN